MKDQIIAALKTKYANLGFTDKAFDGVATFGVASVTDATQIETFVAGVEGLLKAFQGDADSRVNTALAKKAIEPPKPAGVETQPPTTEPAPAGQTATEAAMLKTLETMAESIKGLSAKVEGMETGAATQTRQQKLEAALDKAPAAYKSMAMELFQAKKFENEEAFNDFLTAKVSGVSGFTKSLNEEGLSTLPKPTIAITGKDGKVASNFKEMMTRVVDDKITADAPKN